VERPAASELPPRDAGEPHRYQNWTLVPGA
ncbi:uncharacterized protein METZ01_LOCUS151882, partial [marine metagenome]